MKRRGRIRRFLTNAPIPDDVSPEERIHDVEVRKAVEAEAVEALAGAAAGAAAGIIAGPPGIVAGAVIGAAAGALAGVEANRTAHERARREKDLDAIGEPPVPVARPAR
jgi:hypothetical protein